MVQVTERWVNRCGREEEVPADRRASADGLEVGDLGEEKGCQLRT